MKLGIITQPLRVNYGGVLQNYALHRVLKELGHQPVTIDVDTVKLKRGLIWYLRFAKRLKLKLEGNKDIKYLNIEKQDEFNKNQHIDFLNKHISYIRTQYPLSSSITQKEGFEGYVVGSDQVWRPIHFNAECNHFLDFTLNQSVKRIAYAASFGLDQWLYDSETTEIAKQCVKYYDGVSVREKSGLKLCKEYLNVDAVQVLDPTMLLTADQYREVLEGQQFETKNEILVYVLDLTSAKKRIIDNICAKVDKKPNYIGVPENGNYPSIESWIAGFDKAEFVLTDSFHGTVFSIIFKKQFINIGNVKRGTTRMNSLFDLFGIDKNHIISLEDVNFEQMNNINFQEIHLKLDNLRESSLKFLTNSLF